MSAYDDLLASLEAERHNGGGWKTPEPAPTDKWDAQVRCQVYEKGHEDNEVAIARRRRELDEAFADKEATG